MVNKSYITTRQTTQGRVLDWPARDRKALGDYGAGRPTVMYRNDPEDNRLDV